MMQPVLRFDSESETASEISSNGSEWNDRGTIAMQLGILNPDDMANERFKVDRQKLENLIKGNHFLLGFGSFAVHIHKLNLRNY